MAPMVPLFFSEFAEGTSYNKYVEIYNPTDAAVELSHYAYPTVSNAPSEAGTHEYWNSFDAGAYVPPLSVYVICHPSADALILAHCNETYSYFSNGDDGLCLVYGTETSYVKLDCIGDYGADPGTRVA